MHDYSNDKVFWEGYKLYKLKHKVSDDSKLLDFKVKYQLDSLRELGRNNRMRYNKKDDNKIEMG
jgi:hypothetical protein